METSDASNTEDQSELITRIENEMKLAKYIMTQSKLVSGNNTAKSEMSELLFYTGVEDTEAVHHYFNKQDKTFRDWIEDNEKQKLHNAIVSYEHLRKAVYIEYVEKLRLPTKKRLAILLVSRFNYKNEIIKTLNMDIKKHGFIWKQLGGTKKFIILENTAQVSRRMRYLYEMNQVREANRVIVHVELRKISVDVNTSDPNVKKAHQIEIAVAASPQIGLIGALVNTAADGSINIDSFMNSRLKGIPDDVVLVIEPSQILQEDDTDVPTEHNTKKVMSKWLEKYNLPHFPEYHKGQLFALIEMYKARYSSNSNYFKLLRAKNFKVLFRPPELSYMKYFSFLWENLDNISKNSSINDLDTIKSKYVKLIEEVRDEDWKGYDCDIVDLEQKIFQEDEKLELVVDKLMEAIENNSLTRADFEECEANVDDDEYIDSIIIK